MIRNALRLSIVLATVLVLAQPSFAIGVEDLDLTGFPEGAKVVEIGQNAEGVPLDFCARPTRMRFIQLPGPPTIKWIKVPINGQTRYEHDFVWVKVEIPNPDTGKEWVVEGMECTRKCPEGASGTRCVATPNSCPVCEK